LLLAVACVLLAAPAALAAPGDQLWPMRYNGPGNGNDFANAVGVSPDGSKVFVTGQSPPSNGLGDYATVAYDASTGMQLWAKRYNGPANGADEALALRVSPGGSKVFVTGDSRGSGSNFDYATVAYDATTGAQLWVSRYNAPANKGDFAEAVDVSPNGSKVFVSGVSYGSTSGGDYAMVAYDASTGARLWVSRYTTPGNGFDETRALRVSPDGSKVFATGDSAGSTSIDDYATVAYKASTGAQLWVKRYNGPGNGDDGAHALGLSPDGSKVFVTGPSEGSASSYDYATIAYGASAGAKLWVRRYNGPANGGDGAQALGVSPDGSKLFVTGGSTGSSGADYATVAYGSSAGAKLWVKRYDGPGGDDDGAHALGVSPDGSEVFVTGSSGSPGSADYATVAYSAASGTQLWATPYDGPGNAQDSASALVVGPGGSRVFVTGSSQGSTSGEDFATVAYSIG
jgi:PQQ-like domain